MYLCLDVGNSQIHGGIFHNGKMKLDFRLNTKQGWSSDQLGVMLRAVLREKNIQHESIEKVAISSVVPSIDHHLKNACIKYFSKAPFFVKAGVKTGLSVNRFKNPNEIGADLIASAVCAADDFPDHNLIVVDMGTANTICAINKDREFLGGIITPGTNTQMDSLISSAEKLSAADIEKPKTYLGKTTTNCLQSGIYYGQLGAMKYLINNSINETFKGQKTLVVATGGFSRMFKNEEIFDHIVPDLVLRGILKILAMNE